MYQFISVNILQYKNMDRSYMYCDYYVAPNCVFTKMEHDFPLNDRQGIQ